MPKLLQRCFLALFLGLLGSEGLLRLLPAAWPPAVDPASAGFPQLPRSFAGWRLFPAQFDTAFARGLRLHAWAKALDGAWPYFVFHSTLRGQIWVGRDGMLFNDVNVQAMASPSIAHIKPSDGDLAGVVQRFKARQAVFARAGIPYLIVVVPEKKSVYFDDLPAWMHRESNPARERFMAQALKAGLPVMDVTPALIRAKPSGPLYYRYDVHWNLWGAYQGYREILARWALMHQGDPGRVPPAPAPLAWADLHPVRGRVQQGDLALWLGLQTLLRDDCQDVDMAAMARPPQPWIVDPAHHLDFSGGQHADLMLCGDSLSGYLWPLFSVTVRHLTELNGYLPLDAQEMADARPKFFIDEFGEWRLMDSLVPARAAVAP